MSQARRFAKINDDRCDVVYFHAVMNNNFPIVFSFIAAILGAAMPLLLCCLYAGWFLTGLACTIPG